MTLMFAGDHYQGGEQQVPTGADRSVIDRELMLGYLAEQYGFSSLWVPEHHFSGYAVMPAPLQVLAHLAARTTTLKFGTMVLVLPWHNPARLAGELSMLDNLSGGRVILGVGRGLSRLEYRGMSCDMNDSAEAFDTTLQTILTGLDEGTTGGSNGGTEVIALRPTPTATFRDRTYGAAISGSTYLKLADLGLGLLIIPQAPWESITTNVALYRERFLTTHGHPAPDPIIACQVFCDDDPGRAKELGQQHIGDYYQSCISHYELGGSHFKDIRGYSAYATASDTGLRAPSEPVLADYCALQCIGTPDDCIDHIQSLSDDIGCGEMLGMFSYAGLEPADAKRNVDTFAKSVLPRMAAISSKGHR